MFDISRSCSLKIISRDLTLGNCKVYFLQSHFDHTGETVKVCVCSTACDDWGVG